ncbi:hypothetical protein WN943_028156 [Citrus x changshan-huyou]
MPTWHQLRRRGLTTRQHMIDDMSSLDSITLLTRVSTKILKLACGAVSSKFENCERSSIRKSQHSNLEEGTPRLVAGVEMDSISRSEREATVSAFRTVIESLGNGVKTSLRQIRNLPRRFLDATRRYPDANFWLIYVYSIIFDPVFLYLPAINDGKKCFQFDIALMILVIVEHTALDILLLMKKASRIGENVHRNFSKSLLAVFLKDLAFIFPLPQGFGALWYFFALQRKTECWRKACTDSTKCRLLPLHCDNSLTNYTFSNDFCSTKTQNATIYDFGIFFDAINSGVMEQNSLSPGFLLCIRWSLQNLSSFGQGLPFSTNVWENIFVISITITGVRLFFFLMGKVQYEMSKAEEIRQKVQEIYQWPPFRKLPKELQKKVRKHPASKLRGTTGVDVEMVNKLPEDLRKSIKQNLCLDLLKKVEEFGNWSDSSLETLCDVVKPVVFTERSYILQEGNPIDQMLFVLHGKLWTYTSRSIAGSSSNSGNPNNHLEDGDFSGEELIAWAKADRDSSNLPLSTKTIQALTKVEAFVLMADYLKQVLLDIDH